MNGLLGMGIVGWLVSLVIGFVVGGIFFLSIKVQVTYVLQQRSRVWLVPALMYVRMLFLGVILVLVAFLVPRDSLAAAVIAALFGALAARIAVTRMVRKRGES